MKNIIITAIICAGVFIGGSVYASFVFNAPGIQQQAVVVTTIKIETTPVPTPELVKKSEIVVSAPVKIFTTEERIALLEARVTKLENGK